MQAGICVGETGRVRHGEARAPLSVAATQTRPLDPDVVGLAFARAVEPACQQVAARRLDDARPMIVPALVGEKEPVMAERRRGKGLDERQVGDGEKGGGECLADERAHGWI